MTRPGRRFLTVLACVTVLVPSSAGMAAAQTAPPSSSQESSDKKDEGFFAGRMRSAITEWFKDLVASALRPVFKQISRTVFSTPEIHEHRRVAKLWRFSVSVSDAGLIIFVLAGSGVIIAQGGLGARLSAKELLPRFLTAAILCNLSLVLLGEMIELSNAISKAALGSLDPEEVAAKMGDILFREAMDGPFLALLAIAVIVVALLVVVSFVMRVSILIILAVVGPLLLAAHVLPQTDHLARIWWRAVFANLASQVMQAILLVAAFHIFLSGEGFFGGSGGLIDIMVIGCTLYLLFKLPFWALNASLSGGGSRAWTKTKRTVVRAAKTVAKPVPA